MYGAVYQLTVFILLPASRKMLSRIRGEKDNGIRNPPGIVDTVACISKTIGILFPVPVRILLRKCPDNLFEFIHCGRRLQAQLIQPVLPDYHDLAFCQKRGTGNAVGLSIFDDRIKGLGVLIIDFLQPVRHVLLDILINCFHFPGLNHIGYHLCPVNRENIRKLF